MEIIDYRVLSFNDSSKLADEVMQLVKRGYEPLGGVSTAQNDFKSIFNQDTHSYHNTSSIKIHGYFTQAMVKYKKEKHALI